MSRSVNKQNAKDLKPGDEIKVTVCGVVKEVEEGPYRGAYFAMVQLADGRGLRINLDQKVRVVDPPPPVGTLLRRRSDGQVIMATHNKGRFCVVLKATGDPQTGIADVVEVTELHNYVVIG